MKRIPLSFTHSAEITEAPTQALIIQLSEIQHKLNVHPENLPEVNMKALIRKECDPVNRDGDV